MIAIDIELKSDKGSELLEVVEEKHGLGITSDNLDFLSHYTTNGSTYLTFKANVISRDRYNDLIEKERKLSNLMDAINDIV